MHRIFRNLLPVLLALPLLLTASVAAADALVIVTVSGADPVVDGRVVLEPRSGGESYECQTEDGRCQIDRVPGGRYLVRFEPSRGTAPRPQSAMIAPSGTVQLTVYAGNRGNK